MDNCIYKYIKLVLKIKRMKNNQVAPKLKQSNSKKRIFTSKSLPVNKNQTVILRRGFSKIPDKYEKKLELNHRTRTSNKNLKPFTQLEAQKYLKETTVRSIGTLNPNKIKNVQWKIDNEEFGKFGVGVYLFFDFLKELTIVFGVMSAIALIPIIYNWYGFNMKRGEARFHIERSTLGNSNGSKASFILNLVSDMIYSILFWSFIIYYKRSLPTKIFKAKATNPMPSQYAVEISNIPKDTTELELIKRFSKFGGVVECKVIFY